MDDEFGGICACLSALNRRRDARLTIGLPGRFMRKAYDERKPMSFAVLRSRALAGMEALAVNVEVHLANGLPGIAIVGSNLPCNPQLTVYLSGS